MPLVLQKRFRATDSDGRPVTMLVYVKKIRVDTYTSSEVLDGMKELRTADGRSCNYLERGRYQVVTTGEILTSIEADAE